MNEKMEAAIQQKLAAMFSANKDEVSIPKIYIDMTGDWKAAAILDELLFWTLPKKGTGKTSLRVFRNGGLWLAVRRADWWERKRLTERQADTAIEKLVSLGFIEKDVFLFDGKPTVHIRVVMSEFVRSYGEKIKEMAVQEEDENLIRDISDLYAMMGFPNENVNSNLQNGEMLNLQNGEIINSPVQPLKTTIPLSIENAIFAGVPVTEEIVQKENLRDIAPKMFERALGFSKPLPWWSNKDWEAFGEWVCERYAESKTAFGEYNIWRNTPYTKGGMSNNRIRGFVNEFYDSWDMFKMASARFVDEDNRHAL